ncbi:aminotransferase class IV [Methylobacterium sp. NFXW15]|uniref:aminotransferase class IV n=1 Tax=Methylobacterium sp. NFXW15 TaxID=2819512 RepID=UPI003CEB497E
MLWRDGHVIEGTSAPLDHADRGLTLGDGLFDTALALNGRIAFEEEHVARLVAGAAALAIPTGADAIRTAMRALATRGDRLAIRTTLTRGAGPRGLKPPDVAHPTLFATAAPSGRAIAFAPLRLLPTGIARNDTSPAARLKTLGYLDAVLAAGEAARQGFDEALFLNTKGHVACAGTGNVFCLLPPSLLRSARNDAEGSDGEALALVTPPLSDGVLAGIVRAQVLTLAPACGLSVEERSLSPDDLLAARAVFVTNSLRLLAPVGAIGGMGFDSAGHPAFARLRAALRAAVAESCGVAAEEVA